MERPTSSDSFTAEELLPPRKKRNLKESKNTPPDIKMKKTRRGDIPSRYTRTQQCASFGQYVGQKIRNLPNAKIRSLAENRISNVLFELEMLAGVECEKCYSSSSSSCSDSNPPTPLGPLGDVSSASEEDG